MIAIIIEALIKAGLFMLVMIVAFLVSVVISATIDHIHRKL